MQPQSWDLHRGQTEKFVKLQQGSLGAILCGASFLIIHGIAIGCVWLWAAGETAPQIAINATVINGVNVTQSGDAAWSQWYKVEGIIIIVSQILAGMGLLTQVIIGCNSHVQKAEFYKHTGDLAEASAEEAQEGACVKMMRCVHSLIDCMNYVLGCIPVIWCCIGLFMICFGLGAFGARVTPGVNDHSKYYLIIFAVAVVTGCCACCAYMICASLGVGATALCMSGDDEDDEDDDLEEHAE